MPVSFRAEARSAEVEESQRSRCLYREERDSSTARPAAAPLGM